MNTWEKESIPGKSFFFFLRKVFNVKIIDYIIMPNIIRKYSDAQAWLINCANPLNWLGCIGCKV